MNMGLIGMKGLILTATLLLGGCSGEVVNTFSTKERYCNQMGTFRPTY